MNLNSASSKNQWKSLLASRESSGIPSLQHLTHHSCSCSTCKLATKKLTRASPHRGTPSLPRRCEVKLRLGDRVACKNKTGVIRYMGVMDSKFEDGDLFAGIKLDDPLGDNDGVVKGKRYFSCPDKHGIMVPASQVVMLLPREMKQKTQDGLNILPKDKLSKVSATQTSPVAQAGKKGVPPKPSLTDRLLADLPDTRFYRSPSPDSEMRELSEISDWAASWGGDHQAWAMAGTLERLKRANRRGAQEQNWQRVLLYLEQEMPDELRTVLETVQRLRRQIGQVRAEREEGETEGRELQAVISGQDLSNEIADVKAKIKEEREKSAALMEAVQAEKEKREALKEKSRKKMSGEELEQLERQLAVPVH